MISRSVVMRALKVSLIVGTILNIINQGDILIHLDFTHINLVKFFLTYIVPYSVTTYTAVSLKLEFIIGSKSSINAHLKCRGCEEKIHIHKNELIPECPSCGIKTRWKLDK